MSRRIIETVARSATDPMAPKAVESAACGKIFRWSDVDEWQTTVRKLMHPCLDDAVFESFRARPPEFVVGDDLSWLDAIISRVHGRQPIGSQRALAAKLQTHYTGVVAYHGCRPASLASYRRYGLQPSDPKKLRRLALALFGNTPQVKDAISDLAKEESGLSYQEHNEGRVFFTLTDDHLIEDCGHYLLYGSEYLLCIANHIGQSHKLRRRGRATIIECFVPLVRLSGTYHRCLAGEILEEIFACILDPDDRRLRINFGFPIAGALPPQNILGFSHPRGIPNPHNYRHREE